MQVPGVESPYNVSDCACNVVAIVIASRRDFIIWNEVAISIN